MAAGGPLPPSRVTHHWPDSFQRNINVLRIQAYQRAACHLVELRAGGPVTQVKPGGVFTVTQQCAAGDSFAVS